MADNTTIDNGALTDYVVADDDDGVAKHQYVKVEWGVDGTFTKVAAGASALPIQDGGNVISIDDAGGSLTVDGTVGVSGTVTVTGTVAVSGAVDTELPAAAALADNTANPTVPGVGSFAMGWDGATWDRIRAPGGVVEVSAPSGVSVTSVTPGTGASALGKAEDAIHASGDVGVMALAVRSDAGTVFGADGDYLPLSLDSSGALRVAGGAGGTQYAEDTASAAAEQLTMAGVVRKDTGVSLVDADGDRTELQVNSTGSLRVVDDSGSVTAYLEGDVDASIEGLAILWEDTGDTLRAVSAAKPLPVNVVAGSSGGPSKVDDAAFTVAVDTVAPAGFLADDTATDVVDEGDVGIARMDLSRRQLVRIVGATDAQRADVDASGRILVNIAGQNLAQIAVGDGTFPIEIQASGADALVNTINELVTGAMNYLFNGTTWDRMRGDTTNGLDVDVTRLPALVAGTANIGDVDVLTVPAPLSTTGGGTEATAHRVTIANDSTGVLSVDDNGSTLSIDDGAGSITVDQATAANLLATVTQGPAGTAWEIIGDVAHDAAAPANPVVVGGQMETQADSAPGTRAGTDGDAVKLAAIDGALYVVQGTPQQWSYHEDSSSALTDASVHAAPGAGLSLYVTDIVVSTGAATALNVFFEEATTKVLGPYYLEAVAGRGFAISFKTPKKITANTALTITTSAAIAHAIDVTGYIAPG